MFFKKIQKEYFKSIEELINQIYEEHDIYERDTKNFINKGDLLNKILFRINSQINKDMISKDKKICNSLLKSGNKCNKTVLNEENYCKKHLQEININKNSENKFETIKSEEEKYDYINKSIPNLDKLKYKFINDCFYYIDENFIYDKDSYEKVGYINTIGNDQEFILTQNPFLLGYM